MTEEEFWRREYICPMCLIRHTVTEMFPKCCGHYMVEFEDWKKDKVAWLRSRKFNGGFGVMLKRLEALSCDGR